MQIILTRDHANIPWGFRLKGGTEYNVPLSILKVNEGSPSQYKLECGDVIQTIGNYPALNLKHEEALNLIRLFDLTLPLIIQRPQMNNQFQTMNSMNSTMNRMAPVSMNKQPVTWRPPSQISSQPSSINQQYQPPTQQYQPQAQQYQPPSHQYQQQNQYQQPAQHFTNQYQPMPTQVSPGYQYHQPLSSSNPQQRNSTSSTFSTAVSSASPIHATSNFFAASPTPHQYEYQSSPFSGSSNSNPNSLLMMNTNTNTSSYHQPSSYQGQYQHTGPTSPISVMPVSSPPPAPQLPISVSPSGPPPPPAPPLPVSFNSVNNYRANQGATSSSSHTSHTSTSETRTSSTSGAIPDALLKALNASPMGKKPFTYTPGGLDLSHVRQSARVRRYESMNSGDRMMPNQPNQGLSVGGGGPQPPHHHSQQSFSNNYQSYQKQSTSQTNLSTSGIGGGVGGGGHVHAPSAISTHQRLNSASMNSFETTSQPSVVSAGPPRLQRQASGGGGSPMGFSVTPEQLARSRNIIKQDEPGKDLHNQSFSFKMLNKWIAESESQPVQLRSKKDEEEEQQKQAQQAAIKRSEVIKAIEEEEKRGFHVRNSQSPQTATRMNVVPSKAFQFVDRKFNESADAGNNLTMRRDSYNGDDYSYTGTGKPPARERDQEEQPQKYRGTHIPSKTFKYLQYLTQNELVTDEKPKVPTNNPETQTLSQAEQQASSLRTNTLQYQSPPELLESRQQSNSNRISSMNNSEPSYAQPNLNLSHESDNIQTSEPAFKSLGVKSMMNRFNNLSSSNNTNSSSFPAQLGSTYFQNTSQTQSQFSSQQTNQAAFNSTASSFAHQPMNPSNNRQIVSTTSEFIESQIASSSSSTLPQYNESDSKAAHVDEKVDVEKHLDSDRIDETVREKPAVSAFEENVVLPAAKLEISETLHTEEIEITATNDLNAATTTATTHLSNHSEETNILTLSSNNELIDTNINLNESTKNEQQQQKEEAAESVENNPNKSDELELKQQTTTEVAQETETKVEAESKNNEIETNSTENVESNTLNNETNETTQSQVIETSEF